MRLLPFPTLALCSLDFHGSTRNAGAWNAVGGVVLSRDEEHNDCKGDLHTAKGSRIIKAPGNWKVWGTYVNSCNRAKFDLSTICSL